MTTNVLRRAVCVWTACASCALAGIPEPDAILYGSVRIGGAQVHKDDDVSFIARVDVDRPPLGNFPGPEDSVAQEVGSYHMGDNEAAGDFYVLRLRLESLADGSTQSNDKALIGQTARVYVREGVGSEQPAGVFTITERGLVRIMNLPQAFAPVDFEPDGDVDLLDYSILRRCFQGPLVGDYNGDGKVALNDYSRWRTCLGGPGAVPGGGCTGMRLDQDNDIDLADFAVLQRFFTGSEGSLGPTCNAADVDGDLDVDLADFATFQRCSSGTNIPADPMCAH